MTVRIEPRGNGKYNVIRVSDDEFIVYGTIRFVKNFIAQRGYKVVQ